MGMPRNHPGSPRVPTHAMSVCGERWPVKSAGPFDPMLKVEFLVVCPHSAEWMP